MPPRSVNCCDRFLTGKPVRGLRQVDMSSATDQKNNRLTTFRKEASQSRTRVINKIKHLLRRYNLQWNRSRVGEVS